MTQRRKRLVLNPNPIIINYTPKIWQGNYIHLYDRYNENIESDETHNGYNYISAGNSNQQSNTIKII